MLMRKSTIQGVVLAGLLALPGVASAHTIFGDEEPEFDGHWGSFEFVEGQGANVYAPGRAAAPFVLSSGNVVTEFHWWGLHSNEFQFTDDTYTEHLPLPPSDRFTISIHALVPGDPAPGEVLWTLAEPTTAVREYTGLSYPATWVPIPAAPSITKPVPLFRYSLSVDPADAPVLEGGVPYLLSVVYHPQEDEGWVHWAWMIAKDDEGSWRRLQTITWSFQENAMAFYLTGLEKSAEELIEELIDGLNDPESPLFLVDEDMTGQNANVQSARLNALHNKIQALADLIAAGDVEAACDEALALYQKVDGHPNPPDWIEPGEVQEAIRDLLVEIMEVLGCP
jgi:hypothetical protein